VNPYDVDDVADKIYEAIQLSEEDRRRRMGRLRDLAASRDVTWWQKEFLGEVFAGALRPSPPSTEAPARG
jgi:trehalose 6-phosphate synthase